MQATMPREEGDEAFLEEDDEEAFLDDDDDELLSDPDAAGNSSAEEEELGTDSDGNISGDGVSLAEGSDDDDLVEYDASGAETEQSDGEWGGIGGGDKRKRKDKSQPKRKKRKTLPTFATYEEYATMIEDGPEDEI